MPGGFESPGIFVAIEPNGKLFGHGEDEAVATAKNFGEEFFAGDGWHHLEGAGQVGLEVVGVLVGSGREVSTVKDHLFVPIFNPVKEPPAPIAIEIVIVLVFDVRIEAIGGGV